MSGKLNGIIHGFIFLILMTATCVFVVTDVLASGTDAEPQEKSSWEQAKKEVGEAAQAVGEASKESWGSVKKSGAETWEKTKKEADKDWQTAKKKSGEVWSETKEGTKKGLESTKEESLSFWQKVKKKSKEWYRQMLGKPADTSVPESEEKQ